MKSSLKPSRRYDEEQAVFRTTSSGDASESSFQSSNFSLGFSGHQQNNMEDSSRMDDTSYSHHQASRGKNKNGLPGVTEEPPSPISGRRSHSAGQLQKNRRHKRADDRKASSAVARLSGGRRGKKGRRGNKKTNGNQTEGSSYSDADAGDQSTVLGMDDSVRERKGYFENLAPSRAMTMVLGLFFTLILVIPVTLASIGQKSNKENTNTPPPQDENATNATMMNTNITSNYYNTSLDLDDGSYLLEQPEEEIEVVNTDYNNETERPQAAAEDSEPSSPPPVLISQDTIQYIQSVLHNSTTVFINNITHHDATTDQSLPAFRAYQFLLQDPQVETYPDWRIRQRFAMATFFYAFNGPQWITYTGQQTTTTQGGLDYNIHECDWWWANNDIGENTDEMTCHANDTMARLAVSNMEGFQGTMPEEISMLSHLQAIQFDQLLYFDSPLTHLLTPAMQNLTELTSFHCTSCDLLLEGGNPQGAPLPDNLHEYMPFLQDLVIANSHLIGSLPTQWGLTTLTSLVLAGNDLEGSLPSELGILTNLQLLSLHHNNFKDPVPNDIWSSLTSLRDFDVSGNKLTGTIGTEIGLWTELRHFDIKGGNRMSAAAPDQGGDRDTVGLALPSEIGLLSNNLQALKIGGNRLGGMLPSELSGLSALQLLGLTGNDLQGSIDDLLTNVVPQMSSLQQLALGGNQFQGTLPPQGIADTASSVAFLTLLDISDNLIEGEIPSELGLMTTLTDLAMHTNALNGALPSELALLTALESFSVDGNDVTAQVPQEMCDAIPPLNFTNFQFGWCQGRGECCS